MGEVSSGKLGTPRHELDEKSGSTVDPAVRSRLEQRRIAIKELHGTDVDVSYIGSAASLDIHWALRMRKISQYQEYPMDRLRHGMLY